MKFGHKWGHYSVTNLQKKMIGHNPNLDLVNINVHKNLVKSYPVVLKILSRNKIMTDRVTERWMG